MASTDPKPSDPSAELPARFVRWTDTKARRHAADDHIHVVKAVPWAHGHVLYIVGEGATQTSDEDDTSAEDMVRDWLHLMKDQPPESFNIRIDYVDSWDE